MTRSDGFRVSRVLARRLDIPMKKAFGIAGGTQEVARNVLVQIDLAGGVTGWGEAAPLPPFNGETQADALAAIEHAAPFLVGADVRAFRPLAERIAELAIVPSGHVPQSIATASATPFPTMNAAMAVDTPNAAAWAGTTSAATAAGAPSRRIAAAACAIETAAFDALARARRTSLRLLFGGAETEIITDVTITLGSVADAAREAREFSAFRTLKIKVGAKGSAGADVDTDVARVLAVREARPDARILLDANAGLSVAEACYLARELAARGADIALFEQPIAPGSWEALAEVRAKSGLRIAIDESVTEADDVVAAHAAGAADAANVKIMKSGIARALDIAAATRACGMLPMIGGMVETRLAMGTSACLAAGLGGFAFVDLDTPLFLAEDPFVGGYTQRGERLDLTGLEAGHGCTPIAAR